MLQALIGGNLNLDYAGNEAMNTVCSNLTFAGNNIRKIAPVGTESTVIVEITRDPVYKRVALVNKSDKPQIFDTGRISGFFDRVLTVSGPLRQTAHGRRFCGRSLRPRSR